MGRQKKETRGRNPLPEKERKRLVGIYIKNCEIDDMGGLTAVRAVFAEAIEKQLGAQREG